MGKVVVITGASSGLGAGLAQKFYNENFSVVLAARNTEKMNAITREWNSDKCLTVQTDVSQKQDCEKLIEETIKRFKKIDILICNAGINMSSTLEESKLDVFESLLNTNLNGAIYCTYFALPYIKQTKGNIVGISSIMGYRATPLRTAYSTSKFGLRGFLEALRVELLESGVNVTTVIPGYIKTEIFEKTLNSKGVAEKTIDTDSKKMMLPYKAAEKIYTAIQKRKIILILTPYAKMIYVLRWLVPPKILDKIVYKEFKKGYNVEI